MVDGAVSVDLAFKAGFCKYLAEPATALQQLPGPDRILEKIDVIYNLYWMVTLKAP